VGILLGDSSQVAQCLRLVLQHEGAQVPQTLRRAARRQSSEPEQDADKQQDEAERAGKQERGQREDG